MIRIEIEPVWRFRRDDEPRSMLVMLDFLNEIRATGKITRAAARAGVVSTRLESDRKMVCVLCRAARGEREQGRGTRLTPFGDKLVWAGQRLQARLGPQLQNLAQELETEINELLPHATVNHPRARESRVCRLEAARTAQPRAGHRASTCATSATRIRSCRWRMTAAIWRACICHRVSCANAASPPARAWLIPSVHRVIGFVTREMGLMRQARQPAGRSTRSNACSIRPVRFVNRDPDSGTRLLFDHMLAQRGSTARVSTAIEQRGVHARGGRRVRGQRYG